MSGLKFSLVLVMFLILASEFLMVAAFAAVSEDVAVSALRDAKGVVVSAYQTVLEAEEAGANVSGLLARLNEAVGVLSLARKAYAVGDFEETAFLADSSRDIGSEVEHEAVMLKNQALSEGLQRMVFSVIASVVSVVLIAAGSFWFWQFLKKRSVQAAVL